MGIADYGPVLSDAEYERRIFELYESLPPMPTQEAERELRRRELDLLIDHRLGSRFPREKRDALWAAQQNIEHRRLRLSIESFATALLRGPGRTGLARFAVNEYAKVLTSDELERFIGDE